MKDVGRGAKGFAGKSQEDSTKKFRESEQGCSLEVNAKGSASEKGKSNTYGSKLPFRGKNTGCANQEPVADHDVAALLPEDDNVGEVTHVYQADDQSPDVTTLYLNEIGFIPLLNAEQEVQLAREVASGNRNSKNRMIEANLRLVVAIAKRFQNRGLALLDLVEEGNLGLIRAVEKYNPDLGYRFSTYATWWIKQSIDRALMNFGQTVRYPVHIAKDIQFCAKAAEQLRELLGREPSHREIGEKIGKPVKEVKRLLALHFKSVSTDQSISEDSEMSVIETLCDPQDIGLPDQLEMQNLKANVSVWLGKLSSRHREVVVRRFGLDGNDDCTLEQIGNEVGITRERVRQLQMEALGKLRRLMEIDGIDAEHLKDG